MSEPVRCVVDVSVAIKLFIKQEGSEEAEALFDRLGTEPDTELYVPDLFYAECANVLWQYVRRAVKVHLPPCRQGDKFQVF